MASNIFAKIGTIKGESKDAKHPGEIDVLSWTWGFPQSGSMAMAVAPVQARRASRI